LSSVNKRIVFHSGVLGRAPKRRVTLHPPHVLSLQIILPTHVVYRNGIPPLPESPLKASFSGRRQLIAFMATYVMERDNFATVV